MNSGAAGDGAELADHQLVPDELIVMGNTALEEYRLVRIIIVGEVSGDDVGAGQRIFDETDLLDLWIRMNVIGIWSCSMQ